MDRIGAALGDAARWRRVELLAERPRSVGELAELTCVLEPRAGGRAVPGYRDADGEYRSEGRVRVAAKPRRLEFDLAVPGKASFTGHHDLELTEVPAGTWLRLGLRITATTATTVTTATTAAAIAGIETGCGQVLDHLTAVLTPGKG